MAKISLHGQSLQNQFHGYITQWGIANQHGVAKDFLVEVNRHPAILNDPKLFVTKKMVDEIIAGGFPKLKPKQAEIVCSVLNIPVEGRSDFIERATGKKPADEKPPAAEATVDRDTAVKAAWKSISARVAATRVASTERRTIEKAAKKTAAESMQNSARFTRAEKLANTKEAVHHQDHSSGNGNTR